MDDYFDIEREAALERFIQDELRQLAEGPVFSYLSRFGDAIEERVSACVTEARKLAAAGFPGASVVRAAAGLEIVIRFFLARPLVQGAFFSDDWAQLLSQKMLNGRTAEDRELLPAILRNWGVDITQVKLADGPQIWEVIVGSVWPLRNKYVHSGANCELKDALTAIECVEVLLRDVVDRFGVRLGFTRAETGCWSVISRSNLNPPEMPNLNPPIRIERESPF